MMKKRGLAAVAFCLFGVGPIFLISQNALLSIIMAMMGLLKYCLFILYVIIARGIENPEDFVNLLAGTFTDGNKFSTGNTLPLIGMPWAFNHWAPQTKPDGRSGSWWFGGNDHSLTWLRCTHQPSPWIGDWGWFLFGPQIGNGVNRNPLHFWEPRAAKLKPYLFDATVAPHSMQIELAPTMHGAILRVTFPSRSDVGEKRICFAGSQWTGHGSSPNSWITGVNEKVAHERMVILNFGLHMRAESAAAYEVESSQDIICFRYRNDASVVTVRIATSLISPDQALVNLNREVPTSKSFDDIKLEAKKTWNR